MNTQDQYVVEPTSSHTHSVIMLHGLSSNGSKFGAEFLETAVTSKGKKLTDLLPGTRFIFPTAKRRRSTAFNRAMLTQWFDKARLSDPSYRKEIQLPGLAESAVTVLELIRQEIQLVTPRNVLLGGLSQGCAMALSVLMCLDHPIGGFVGMSGYLPFREDIEDAIDDDTELDKDDPFALDDIEQELPKDPVVKAMVFERDLLGLSPLDKPLTRGRTSHLTPIFLGHGSEDDKIPCVLGEAAGKVMKNAGYDVELKVYPGLGHWYKIPNEVDDIVEFIDLKAGWKLEELTG
ncbi:phospholipase/carboxylesterase [Whalleya microplaca]|nr:phospholipase/carboxylesterase [Whalleya microplaca]